MKQSCVGAAEGNKRQEIRSWLKEQEAQMLQDLAELISIPSVALKEAKRDTKEHAPFGSECRRVLNAMEQIGVRAGMQTEDLDGYCLCLTAGKGAHEIGIWNHLDVVPEGEGWEYPPYQLTQRGEFLIGRGVQDNKGPAIAVLYALKYCMEQGLLQNIRVRQILGCQEETGMQDVDWYLAKRPAPEYSFVADCGFPVCCGEKGHAQVTFVTKDRLDGIVSLQAGTVANSIPAKAEAILEGGEILRTEGIGGHAAFPAGGLNALYLLGLELERRWNEDAGLKCSEKTAAAVQFLRRAAEGGYGEKINLAQEDEISGPLTCNAGIAGMQDGHLMLVLDIRYPISASWDAVEKTLREEGMQAGFEITQCHNSNPYYMEKTHPFVQILMESWREKTGLTGEPYVMGGGTYARKIPNAVAFGPGLDRDLSQLQLKEGHGNCHGADEAECLENLRCAVEIYVEALIKLDQTFSGF